MSKKIIITGTSRGIGFELVHLFAQQGHMSLVVFRKDGEDVLKMDYINY